MSVSVKEYQGYYLKEACKSKKTTKSTKSAKKTKKGSCK